MPDTTTNDTDYVALMRFWRAMLSIAMTDLTSLWEDAEEESDE